MENDDWNSVKEFVHAMKNTSSIIQKKKILKDISPFVQKILHYTYNPFKKYHVTGKQCEKKSKIIYTVKSSSFFELLDSLNDKLITGHDAIGTVNAYVKAHDEYSDIIYSVLDRNIEIRASDAIINDVFPYLIPTFDVALAYPFESKFCDFEKETWFASRKLDGVRCVVYKRNGSIMAYSRQGHEFTTLQKILDTVCENCEEDVVLDGEVCLMHDDLEDFQGIMKEIKRKNHTIQNAKYIVFDCLTIDEFDRKVSSTNFSDRVKRLDGKFNNGNVVKLKHTLVKSIEHLNDIICTSNKMGYEGTMIRKDVAYEGKRTKKLLKCKSFFDAEYVVVDIDYEDFRIVQNGREETVRMMAQVWIEHDGFRVGVGSGWSHEQRILYYTNPNEIIGKTITVQYFEETKNKSGGISLRFPTVKYVHGEKRDV